MYQDATFGQKTMGDVDVIFHDGIYHLFHLVLPNHDFVAHAVSHDGLNWDRVENAVFIGHPGNWDDHMLWTMHVTPDPWRSGRWRMFYTGISRQDHGRVQRVGCAYSDDLYRWEKASDSWKAASEERAPQRCRSVSGPFDSESPFPLEAAPPHYESTLDEGRDWVSFRDPFYFQDDGGGRLLIAARINEGPIIRRGCVAMFREAAPLEFELCRPLHYPGQYDDVEVPNLFRMDDRYFLLGSIREDAKVRYWYADGPDGPWANYFDNVLLPAGNYAARVCFDERGPLIWNFFTSDADRTVKNLMPPPKRLGVREDGRLTLRSFEGFDRLVESCHTLGDLLPIARFTSRQGPELEVDESADTLKLTSQAGFEGFLFSQTADNFRFQARLHLDGLGKCGILFRLDAETSSGYHISLDLLKGIAQLRAWGRRPGGEQENAFRFQPLQSGYWQSCEDGPWSITVIALGNYLEFAIDGHVLLTLSDETYQEGRLGLYVESACLRVEEPSVEPLTAPHKPTEHLPSGKKES